MENPNKKWMMSGGTSKTSENQPYIYIYIYISTLVIFTFWLLNIAMVKGSLGGEISVLRTFRMSGKELVKERVSKERVRQGKS